MNITLSARARVIAAMAVATVGLAACGDDRPLNAPADAAATSSVAPTAAPAVEPAVDAVVKISQTALGEVLADASGKTLYAFTNDVEAKSTCYGTCAEAWPPVLVASDFVVSPGLDSGIFATTVRDDGQLQLVAGKYPLYLFAADAKPGDIAGQGSGDVWFAVDTSGRLITDVPADSGAAPEDTPAPAPDAPVLGVGQTELGQLVTDSQGMTLYLFTPDEAGTPTCTGGCADTWPPVLVDGELIAPEGVDPALLSTVEHPDGGLQLKLGKWPLYRFSGDAGPGDVNGQGSGGKWFVVGTDGKAIK